MDPDKHDNANGRLLAIGDIHGCLDQLLALVARVKPAPNDRIVFLGDYIDRGPDSAGVIEHLIEFGAAFPQSVFLRGNHEQMFLDYLDGIDTINFLINGGTNTLNSYNAKGWLPVPDAHIAFLQNLSNYSICDDFIFVHAGLRPGVALDNQEERDLLWIRHEFINSDFDWGKTIVYGHTPLAEPLITSHRMGLDTGCVYGRQLTCCDVRSGKMWHVKNTLS